MSLLKAAQESITNQVKHWALNAFLNVPHRASQLELAQAADEREATGRLKSSIDGRFIAIKDNICTAHQPTTCASNMLKGFTSPYTATVVRRLQAAGAIIAGKTNLDEFGMGSHSTYSAFGAVLGDIDSQTSAGGSSGGSAVAVATGQCWAALGTDTGGSIRLPAAYNRIVGFKPSYGRVSRHGVIPYANSLDTVGIMAKDLTSVRRVFGHIQGYDYKDPTSLSPRMLRKMKRFRSAHLNELSHSSIRVGVPREYNIAELDPQIRRIWLNVLMRLRNAGHSIIGVSLPSTKLALPAYYVLAPAEASSNLAKYDGARYGNPAVESRKNENVLFATARGEGLGKEVKRRILLGSFTLSASAMDNYFIQAQKVRRLIQQDFDRVFARPNPLAYQTAPSNHDRGIDVLLTPTAPSFPPTLYDLGSRTPLDSYRDDVLTVPASLAGLPSISIPASDFFPMRSVEKLTSGHVGFQLTTQFGYDELLFDAGGVFTGSRQSSPD